MKRYLFLILFSLFLLSLSFYLQAKSQTNFLNQTTSSSSSGSIVASSSSSSSSGSPCDIELSMTITNVSYPNGCNVGFTVTCCPLSQIGAGFITYGDSLGDDYNDLIVSWTVDCAAKKVTFTGSGESDCFAQATTICGNVSNKNGIPHTCNLPFNSVCCPETVASSSGVLSSSSGSYSSDSIINNVKLLMKVENQAIKNIKGNYINTPNPEETSAASNFFAISLILPKLKSIPNTDLFKNASAEMQIELQTLSKCIEKHDEKASKVISELSKETEDVDLKSGEKKRILDDLKKADKCKQKLLEDLETLAKKQKK